MIDNKTIRLTNNEQHIDYKPDLVFTDTSQEVLYNQTTQKLVTNFIKESQSANIFAYGAKKTGKSFTLIGGDEFDSPNSSESYTKTNG